MEMVGYIQKIGGDAVAQTFDRLGMLDGINEQLLRITDGSHRSRIVE